MTCKSHVSLPILILVILSTAIPENEGKNILFFMGGLSSFSHRVSLEPLANKLADKGHNVTFYSPPKPNIPHPNITEFCNKETVDAYRAFKKEFGVAGLQFRLNTRFNMDIGKGTVLFDAALDMCEITLKSAEFQDIVQRSQFDLLVFDKTTMTDCTYALAHKFNTSKIISFVAIGLVLFWDTESYGVPTESSWIPHFQSVYETRDPSFFDRLLSEYHSLRWHYLYENYFLPKADKMTREALKMPDMPPLRDTVNSEAIVLLNSHYSDSFAKSLPPFIINIGGMHASRHTTALPSDLENFLQGPNDGFIYISFGSIIAVSTLPPKYQAIFMEAIESFHNLKFLFKWEGDLPKNAPENVLFRNWFPQHDVLAHKKIRGYITQGGHMSTQQAIYNGVPLIVLPVNGDQDYNSKRIRNVGNGIILEFFDLTTEILTNAIKNLLEDKRYARVASQLSNASKHRPIDGVDLAVWWTEFVLTQDDLSYLKPQSMNKPWWLNKNLDVYAFVFLSIVLLVVLLCTCVVFSFRRFVFKTNTSMPTKSNAKAIKKKSS